MMSIKVFATGLVLLLTVFECSVSAYGDYVPKAVYLINEEGYESEPISVRNKRDVEDVLVRIKRGGGNAYSYSGSSSGADYSGGFGAPPELADIQANIEHIANRASEIPNQVLAQVRSLAASQPSGSGSGAYSYSGSSAHSGSGSGYGGGGSSGSGYNGGGSSGSGYGGQGSSGHGSGYQGGSSGQGQGPNIFSRSGEAKGTGIKVSSAAQGPHAAFSSSSSAADGQGNVKYNVKSAQY